MLYPAEIGSVDFTVGEKRYYILTGSRLLARFHARVHNLKHTRTETNYVRSTEQHINKLARVIHFEVSK